MEEIIRALIPTIPGAAWSVIILVLGGLYIYRKIESNRKVTKDERDKDSQDLHDKIMRHDWEINQIKADNNHRDVLLEDLRKQVEAVNQNLAIVATKLDSLVEAVKGKK
jgi:hypothetical protein